MLVVALLCLLCTACAAPASDNGSDPNTSSTPPTELLINADVTKVLTAQQVSDALGVAVTASDALEYGTQLRFSNQDGSIFVDLTMAEGTLADLQQLCSGDGFIAAPNLPREAYWYEQGRELLVWYDGYWLSISVTVPDTAADELLVCARALARTAIENIA